VDEKGWERWKESLPKSHIWACVPAIKNRKKGRARGGFIIGKKKEWKIDRNTLIERKGEGVIRSEIVVDKECLAIISVYGEQGGKKLTERLEEMLKVEEEENIIGGDFNLRLGNLGSKGGVERVVDRQSKDTCIGNGGRGFIDWISEKGWEILNGDTEGDWEGEFTYVGARGSSVIDYVVTSVNIGNRVRKFRIGDGVDSDHMPLEVTLKMRSSRRQRKRTQEKTRGEA